MKKIISIVGARPQFIKLAPFSKAIRRHYNEILVHTGQHYNDNISSIFFRDLDLSEPKYNLNIGSGGHSEQTAKMMIAITAVVEKETPDLVVVFGDTNSTLAGALAIAKTRIPILHVEAGLRSNNRSMPEEINRILVDHISDYLFAPTQVALSNLNKENLGDRSYITGDIMVDTVEDHIDLITKNQNKIISQGLSLNDYYLLTLHRPCNVDDPMNLYKLLLKLSQLEETIIFPVHPRTYKVINNIKIDLPPNIIINEPLGYIDFLTYQYFSKKIITDSGGIQKEAYVLGKPCITLRTETEWIETVESGWNMIISPEMDDIAMKVKDFNPVGARNNIFGINVAEKMLNLINGFLEER